MTTMFQLAPYPVELLDLVSKCTLNPGWSVKLEVIDRGQGSKGLTLIIHAWHPERGEIYGVLHYFIVPAASYNRRSWQRWLWDRYVDVLRHEGGEFFVIDGKRPFNPNHDDGNDPYVLDDGPKANTSRR
jgi:hypothetical protein